MTHVGRRLPGCRGFLWVEETVRGRKCRRECRRLLQDVRQPPFTPSAFMPGGQGMRTSLEHQRRPDGGKIPQGAKSRPSHVFWGSLGPWQACRATVAHPLSRGGTRSWQRC